MEGLFPLCIFCSAELPPLGRRGRGEHIVPESLMGSWRTKDVCRECNSYFGAHVDHKALEEERIVAAIHQLNLPELKAKIRDKAKSTTVDLETGRSLRAKTKGGIAQIVRQEVNGVIDHDEEGVFDVVLRTELHRPRAGQTEADIREEVRRVQALYARLSPGQAVTSDKFEKAYRKAPARTTYEPTLTLQAASRLVAKIAYEVAFVFLSLERLTAYEAQLRRLGAHARHGAPIDEIAIFPMPYPRRVDGPEVASYAHATTCVYEDHVATIDVSFFGYAEFRVPLFPKPGVLTPIALPTYEGVAVSTARLVMTFEPGVPRERRGLLFLVGKEKPLHFDVTGTL